MRRKILLWKRANLGSLQATISEFTTDFVKSMWLIRIMELSLLGAFAPWSIKFHPWNFRSSGRGQNF